MVLIIKGHATLQPRHSDSEPIHCNRARGLRATAKVVDTDEPAWAVSGLLGARRDTVALGSCVAVVTTARNPFAAPGPETQV